MCSATLDPGRGQAMEAIRIPLVGGRTNCGALAADDLRVAGPVPDCVSSISRDVSYLVRLDEGLDQTYNSAWQICNTH